MVYYVVRVHTHPLYVDIEDVCVTYHADVYSAIWTDLGSWCTIHPLRHGGWIPLSPLRYIM